MARIMGYSNSCDRGESECRIMIGEILEWKNHPMTTCPGVGVALMVVDDNWFATVAARLDVITWELERAVAGSTHANADHHRQIDQTLGTAAFVISG